MAGLFKLRELEARREALVRESDVLRRALTLDMQNLQIAGGRMKQQVSATAKPVLGVLGAVAGVFAFRQEINGTPRRRRKRGALGWLLLSFRLYRRFGTMLLAFLARSHAGGAVAPSRAPETESPEPEQATPGVVG